MTRAIVKLAKRDAGSGGTRWYGQAGVLSEQSAVPTTPEELDGVPGSNEQIEVATARARAELTSDQPMAA